jgi:hypothetical protein
MTEMETILGYKLGHVRLFTDNKAANMVRNLDAEAFTVGSGVFIPEENLNTVTGEGRSLLAHELTHVIQQTKPDKVPLGIDETTGSPTSSGFMINSESVIPELVHHPVPQFAGGNVAASDGSDYQQREVAAESVERSVREDDDPNRRRTGERAIDPEEIAERVYQLMQQELWLENDRIRR